MSFSEAIRWTEILIAWAIFLQSLEHVWINRSVLNIFGLRLVVALIVGTALGSWIGPLALFVTGIALLVRFNGPYNGGSDRMGLLLLFCLTLAELPWPEKFQQAAFGYLAVQLVLSYFLAGVSKFLNQEWWSGVAIYKLRTQLHYLHPNSWLALWPQIPWIERPLSWMIIAFECGFPLFLSSPFLLKTGLILALVFHLAIAQLLGLNRFLWIWLAAYPSVIWLQTLVLSQ